MYDGWGRYYPDDDLFEWSLSTMIGKDETSLLFTETLQVGNLYVPRRICVPKTACLSFSLKQQDYRVSLYHHSAMVLLDGVVYSQADWRLLEDYSHRTLLLGECTVNAACDSSIDEDSGDPKEALLNVTLKNVSLKYQYDSSSLELPTNAFDWDFQTKQNDDDKLYTYPSKSSSRFFSEKFDDFIPVPDTKQLSTFRMISCVPNNICMSNIRYKRSDLNIDDFTVSKNGVPSIDQAMSECTSRCYDAIPFDNGCDKDPLSAWAITGISIGSIAGVILLVTVSTIVWKQRRSLKNETVMTPQP